MHFWDSSVWSWMLLFGVLFGSLLFGHLLKKIPLLKKSLIPTSVLGGAIILLVTGIYKLITKDSFFEADVFNGKGHITLEVITYHSLALGFIASALKTNKNKMTKKRTSEIFNTGVTTVATYLIQGIVGLGATLLIMYIAMSEFFPAAGVLLPFGFGQGTGQAMNYGAIYEKNGFANGTNFGLAIAAIGFISASVGGVVHLHIMKKKGKLKKSDRSDGSSQIEEVAPEGEIPLQESLDKITVQVALVVVTYVLAYGIMALLGSFFGDGLKSVIYGFNFLLGVLMAVVVKAILNFLNKKQLIRRKQTNNFLLTRISNFFFDLMIVAGVAAIQIETLASYVGILAILSVLGIIVTYAYNRIVAKTLFPDYREEQFLMMYGMLTGTASTGTILLREIDENFSTPAADNMVYQNFPAIVFGLPMMFLATLAITKPVLTLIIFVLFFAGLNVILFRSKIFKRRGPKNKK